MKYFHITQLLDIYAKDGIQGLKEIFKSAGNNIDFRDQPSFDLFLAINKNSIQRVTELIEKTKKSLS